MYHLDPFFIYLFISIFSFFLFVLIYIGNHTPLVKAPCRGYPCGVEEIGAEKLGACLAQNYGWKSTCGAAQPPPSDIAIGDVLIFHGTSCEDIEAHATIVSDITADGEVLITCNSNNQANVSWKEFSSEFGYNDWLHFVG